MTINDLPRLLQSYRRRSIEVERSSTIHYPSPAGRVIHAISAVVWKDLAAEFRSRELLSAMLVFSLLVILIFNFALELDIKTRQSVTAGVLWATFAFAGTLGLNRSMAVEKDRGCLDGLLLAPVDRAAIYFGKVISNLAFMLIVEVIVIPIYSVLYNVNLFKLGLLAVVLLGSIGYTAVGTLLCGDIDLAGVAFMLISAALYALHLPVTQRVLYDVPAPTVTVYTLLAMSAIVIPAYFVVRPPWPDANAPWIPILGLTAVTTISRLMLFLGVKNISGMQTALLGLSELLVAIFFSCLLLGETLTAWQWAGTAGLGVSLLLVWFEKPVTHPLHTKGLLSWLQPPEFPTDFFKH